MSKPHLFMRDGVWWCTSSGGGIVSEAFAKTAKAAYLLWQQGYHGQRRALIGY
jgi:hypothetical protein